MTFDATAATIAAAAGLLAAAPAVTISAPGHSPRIGKHWNYTVHVRVGGKPAAVRISEAIVDPIGGVHAVQFGNSKKTITNWPVKGTFSDFIIWPAESRGIPLTLRITVKSGEGTKVLAYHVTPTG